MSYAPSTLPPPRNLLGPANSNMPGSRPARMSGVRIPGVMSPDSDEFEAITRMLLASGAGGAGIPSGGPLSQFLISSGYAAARPGTLPEYDARQNLSRNSLNSISQMFGGGGGRGGGTPLGAPGMATGPMGGGGGNGPAIGGGPMGLPGRVDLGPILSRINSRPAHLGVPARLPAMAEAPPMAPWVNSSGLRPPPGIPMPTAGDEGLQQLMARILSAGPYRGR